MRDQGGSALSAASFKFLTREISRNSRFTKNLESNLQADAALKYIPVLDVRHVKILDHENTVQDNLKFSSSQSII
jgi:hypothetical protein